MKIYVYKVIVCKKVLLLIFMFNFFPSDYLKGISLGFEIFYLDLHDKVF